jgi:hypothetical protein
LATWKEKKAAANKGPEKKEKEKEERRRGSGGSRKKGGYESRGGGNQQSLHLVRSSGRENVNAKVPKVQELSDSASDDEHSDDTGSGNGNRSD